MASITAQTAKVLEDASNVREDLGNVIFNVSQYLIPFTKGIAKTKATADNHEWLTDSLDKSSVTAAAIEAEEITTTAPGTRTRKGNYLQISNTDATVTLKAEMFDKAGVPGKEIAYQVVKKGKEVMMRSEENLLAINAKVAPTASTAGELAGVASWINTNESVSSTGGTANSASTGATVPTPGTNRTLTDAIFSQQIDNVWTEAGDFGNVCVMADAARVGSIRDNVSGMSDSVESDAHKNEIVNRVAVYASQFGPVKVVPNKHMPANTIYINDMSTWAVAYGGGKATIISDIPIKAAAESKLIECYHTLEARAEEANAGIYAIT